MKKLIILMLLMSSAVIWATAQEAPGNREIADDLFERYEYFKAVNIYLKLWGHTTNAPIVERIATCYRLMNDYPQAETWYRKAAGLPKALPMDAYYYAESLLHNNKLNQAREQFRVYYNKNNDNTMLQFKLATCDSAEKWTSSPAAGFTIKNEERYNSKYSDWGMNYFGKDAFVFTSDRKTSNDRKDINYSNGDGYLKLYYTDKDELLLFPLKTGDDPLFRSSSHVGPIAFNEAKDTAYITVTTAVSKNELNADKRNKHSKYSLYTRRLQLIMATKVNGDWSHFKSFPYNNINEYSLGHATLSKNGEVIYFTSDMPGGEGKTDIWYCQKQADGKWDKPVNCGKTINTKEEEAFPIVNGDGNLYFSSTGLPGMGGLDIYKTKGEKATWVTPENLKSPVNSTNDDFYYVTNDGLSGYLSSNRGGGMGNDDIYSFVYKEIAKPKPVITATASKVIVPAAVNKTPRELTTTSVLKKGDTFLLKNIYYNLNKADIRPDAALELDKLVAILKAQPSVRIEVRSHTDSRAPSAYNLVLSNRRAASAVAYLVKHGIDANRPVPKGYGDTQLLNNCGKGQHCTEEEHQLNRRTEVRILSNND